MFKIIVGVDIRRRQHRHSRGLAAPPRNETSVVLGSATCGFPTVTTNVFPCTEAEPASPQSDLPSPNEIPGASQTMRSERPPWCDLYISKTWNTVVATNLSSTRQGTAC